MPLIKRDYTDEETVITAQNLNDIQDAVKELEEGLLTVDDDRSGEVISITDAAKRGFKSLNIYGKTTQNGTPTPEAPVELVSAGNTGSISISITGKNLFQIAAKTTTLKGCTVTVNADGSITLSGTCTENTSMRLGTFSQVGTFIISGGATNSQINQSYIVSVHDPYAHVYWSGKETTFTNSAAGRPFDLVILAGTYNDVTIRPMIRHATVADSTYEPYKAQKLTIATPNGLPGIPVTSGGNYTDANGQQWICDEIDYFRGVYIKRVVFETVSSVSEQENNSAVVMTVYTPTVNWNPASQLWLLTSIATPNPNAGVDRNTTPNVCRFNSYGTTIIFDVSRAEYPTLADFNALIANNPVKVAYIRETPIETPLTKEELTAYAALYTYKDNTTISNDAGVHMDLEYVMDAKTYIDGVLKLNEAPRIVNINLPASKWIGTGNLFSQEVYLAGITANSQVNLTPTISQMATFYEKDITFITENDGGVVTVYVVGQKPQNDYTIPANIVEVRV